MEYQFDLSFKSYGGVTIKIGATKEGNILFGDNLDFMSPSLQPKNLPLDKLPITIPYKFHSREIPITFYEQEGELQFQTFYERGTVLNIFEYRILKHIFNKYNDRKKVSNESTP